MIEELEGLEAQRAFLLRSLDDLEEERAAGNIDDETYARLHGDYTARAASVLRALSGDAVEVAPGPPPVSRARRTLVLGALVAFAIAAAVTLAITIAPRKPGGTVTGGVSAPSSGPALKAAVADHPNDYSARIGYARYLLGTDRVAALRQYTAAGKLDPTQAEPPTYIGWILGLASSQVGDTATHDQLVNRALQEFALARRIDPRYPDSYVFEGLVRDRFANDPAGAVPLLERYLQLSPDGPQVDLVRNAITDARNRVRAGSTTTVEPTTSTTTR